MISVCICTFGRPEILRRCLVSIYEGQLLPAEIIVSDDSPDPAPVQGVCQEFPLVRYVRGPQTGLCANRNVAVAACSSDYIALLDDDAIASADFLRLASDLASQSEPCTILTGDILENGTLLISPTNPSFWGHFGEVPHGSLRTINLNCNLFPRSAFQETLFDEAITYGYEDMDLCEHLLARGYKIAYHSELVNQHCPPAKNAMLFRTQKSQSEQARYYTSLKRYYLWQRKPLKALAYVVFAPLHRAVYHLKRRELAESPAAFVEMFWAIRATANNVTTAKNTFARKLTKDAG